MKQTMITLYGHGKKHLMQMMSEAQWILGNLSKAKKISFSGDEILQEKGAKDVKKWTQKWMNWSKAHPDEAKQIKEQILKDYNKNETKVQVST